MSVKVAGLQMEVDRLHAELARLSMENEALRRERGEGPLSVVVRLMSGEEAAVMTLENRDVSVVKLKELVAQQTGVDAESQRLCTEGGQQLSTEARPARLSDTLPAMPPGARLELTMAVVPAAWHPSEAFALSRARTLATRTVPTNGQWAVLRSVAPVALEGVSEFTTTISSDPSDGCWMLGVMTAAPAPNPPAFRANSHADRHRDYRNAFLYRSDNGDVWFDGQQLARVEPSGNSTGKVAKVSLHRPGNDSPVRLVIAGTSHSGKDIEIEAGGFLEEAALEFVILTYRQHSAFSSVDA